ncbi:hypothetical protein E0K83_07555 [Gramella sp. BOM4]|nr:hypothetical protein [Christiangramia bathymodioli]
MKTARLCILLCFSMLYPSVNFCQEWNWAVDHINDRRAEITSITYYPQGSESGEHVDSIFIRNNENYDQLVIELYNTMIEPDGPVEYVTAVDLPLQNLVEVSNFEGQLTLSFKRNCTQKEDENSENLILYTTSERENYVMQAAFKHLSNISKEYHKLRHARNDCELGKLKP